MVSVTRTVISHSFVVLSPQVAWNGIVKGPGQFRAEGWEAQSEGCLWLLRMLEQRLRCSAGRTELR